MEDIFEGLEFIQELRYGENPHQKAQWYGIKGQGLTNACLLQGKPLSYNNLIDLEAAIATVQEFPQTRATVVVKHTNPCGVAIGSDSITRALDCDRTSAFGGIIAHNNIISEDQAKELVKDFYECIVAVGFTESAKQIFATKKNLRILELDVKGIKTNQYQFRSILGGMLIQEMDNNIVDPGGWQVVTDKKPTEQEINDLQFAWKVCRHVHSNAIVLAQHEQVTGIGAGQMNRVGSASIAFAMNKNRQSVLASDGFFPFNDTVISAKGNGITALIQPGGSMKDQDSIDACNELNMSMIFTNTRHFLH